MKKIQTGSFSLPPDSNSTSRCRSNRPVCKLWVGSFRWDFGLKKWSRFTWFEDRWFRLVLIWMRRKKTYARGIFYGNNKLLCLLQADFRTSFYCVKRCQIMDEISALIVKLMYCIRRIYAHFADVKYVSTLLTCHLSAEHFSLNRFTIMIKLHHTFSSIQFFFFLLLGWLIVCNYCFWRAIANYFNSWPIIIKVRLNFQQTYIC